MDDNSEEVLQNTPKIVQNISPRPRSLHIHGFFSKPATKVGMVATKAYFRLINFLQREINIPPPGDLLFGKQPTEAQAKDAKDKKDSEDLQKVVTRSHEVLATATTVFPFTLFPDTLTVDRTKVTLHRRSFFFVSDVMSIRIEDILNVSCGVGPLFGSITIVSRVITTEDHFTLNFFWRNDAIHLKHILQGYVIALHNDIECRHLERDKLIATLKEIGHDANS